MSILKLFILERVLIFRQIVQEKMDSGIQKLKRLPRLKKNVGKFKNRNTRGLMKFRFLEI